MILAWLLVSVVCVPARAGGVEPYWSPPLVGFTSATIEGNQGVLNLTLACQNEFSGTRVCTSAEVLRTFNVPDFPTPPPGLPRPDLHQAWIMPTLLEATPNVDMSGVQASNPGNFTCSDVTSQIGGTGLVIGWASAVRHGYGLFSLYNCMKRARVACCGPATPVDVKPPAP